MPVQTRAKSKYSPKEVHVENDKIDKDESNPKKVKKSQKSLVPIIKEDILSINSGNENKLQQAEAFWLMKSEPETRMQNGQDMKFGIEDLKKMKNQTEHWDGVRNYEARNYMKSMKLGQKSFFYHSNCKTPGIAGIMEIVREAYPDHTQFDPKDAHYDPKSVKSEPKWIMVDIKFVRDLKRFIPLTELKELHLDHKNAGRGELEKLSLFTRSRLSIQSITQDEWNYILDLENK